MFLEIEELLVEVDIGSGEVVRLGDVENGSLHTGQTIVEDALGRAGLVGLL